MPNTHTTLASLFTATADAIRAKTGDTADIVADDFPTAIAAIPNITVVSGTVTPEADTVTLLIPTPYENAKLLIVKVNDITDLETDKCFVRVTWQGADIDANFSVEAASFGYNTTTPSSPYKGFTVAINSQGNIVIMGIANWKFPAGVQYNWTAYYWD